MVCLWLLILAIIASSAAVPDQRGGHAVQTTSSAAAQIDPETYLQVICVENYTYSAPNRPCEVMYTILYQCITGLDYNDDVSFEEQYVPDCQMNCQSDDFQRNCLCQSQYIDAAYGCYRCFIEHGGEFSEFLTSAYEWTGIPVFWKDYCDPKFEVTKGYMEYLLNDLPKATKNTSSTLVDPIGPQTDVGWYFIPNVTGIEAWSTNLSAIDGWSSDALKRVVSTVSVDATSTSDGVDTVSTSLNTPAPVPTASGPVIAIITPVSFSIVWPSRTPSLASDTSASPKNGVSIRGLVGILGFLVMFGML